MNIAVEEINKTKKRLKIEIPSDIIEREIVDSLKRLKQKAKIPGFRPGMAPMNLIEKRFGREVEAEVLDRIIPEYFNKALKETELEPITFPMIDEKVGYKRNNPLSLSFTFEVMPKIDNLQYEDIKIKEIPVIVDDSDIDDYLKKLQEERAIYEVSDKEIEINDMVSFEFVDCKIKGEEDVPLIIKDHISKMGNEILPPDIMEKVLGKKKGDIIEFTTIFDETCKTKELVGKTVDIEFKISEVKKRRLPLIDEEFAKDLGFENISKMREKIKERIFIIKKDYVERMQKAKIVNDIIDLHSIDVPEILLKRELESLMIQEGLEQKESERIESDKGESEQERKDPESLQKEMENRALRNVRASIIIDAIGKKEGITVTDEEVNERISLLAKRLSSTPESIRKFYTYKEGSLEGLRHSIFEDKVLDMLLSKAVIEKGE